jgi:hypothetical protein
MRSYIFTALERQILRGWFKREVTLKDIRLQKVLSRVRLFKDLAADVDLYLKASKAVAAKK